MVIVRDCCLQSQLKRTGLRDQTSFIYCLGLQSGSGFSWLRFLIIFMRVAKHTLSARDKYTYQRSLTSHEGVVCETSTRKEDWRKLKDYFADAATHFNVKKVSYSVWFRATLPFIRTKTARMCNIKSAIASNTKREPTRVSRIASKRLVILFF